MNNSAQDELLIKTQLDTAVAVAKIQDDGYTIHCLRTTYIAIANPLKLSELIPYM